MLNAISAGRDRRWCGSSSKQSAPAPTSLQRGYGTKRQPEGPKDNRRARDLPGRNVPDGSLADIRQSPSYVRFTPESGGTRELMARMPVNARLLAKPLP
jgi:hypothetical protein